MILEEAVIGAMLIDKKGVDEVIDILQPEAFYKEANQHVFSAIHELFETSEPIDLLNGFCSTYVKWAYSKKLEEIFILVQLIQKGFYFCPY